MEPPGVVSAFDVVEDGPVPPGPGWPGPVVDELALDRGEEALGDGVVPAFPLRETDRITPLAPARAGPCWCTAWTARSEWKITPAAGRRVVKAIARVSSTRLVRMWSARAQPTTRRLDRSITV